VQHQLNPLQEGQDGLIDLKAADGDGSDFGDDDPRAVKLMVDYLYLDDYDPSTVPAANPIPLAENVKGEDSAVEHAVVVTQTDPSCSDQLVSTGPSPFGNPSTSGFGNPSTSGFGNPSTPSFGTGSPSTFGAASTPAFGTAPTGFGAASFAPQSNEIDTTFGGFGSNVYQPKKKKKKGKAPPSFLEMHAKVFAIASKYDIKTLERAACEKFRRQSVGEWSPADLIAAIDIVFNRTADDEISSELRNVLKEAIVRRAIDLVQYPGFKEAAESIDGLLFDLFCRKTNLHG
jgi:hypothetical protein